MCFGSASAIWSFILAMPGIIASDMSAGAFDADAIKRMVPMQRAGQPQEVADLVAFLASDRAAYISGQTIGINGALYQ